MKNLIRAIRRFLRLTSPSYVVIYDRHLQPGEAREEWYGYFGDIGEARAMYAELEAGEPGLCNPRLAVVLDHHVPGRQVDI